MDREMLVDTDECDEDMSGDFIFSRPNIIPSPEKITNSGIFSDSIFGGKGVQQSEASAFVFAKPAIINRFDNSEEKNNIISSPVKPISNAIKKVKNASPFSLQDIKKSSSFTQLEKNTKKNQSVRLEISKSITCSEVPESMMLKAVAKEYFDQFGETLKITIRPKRKMITVYYATKEAANKAFAKSGIFLGHSFIKEWTTLDLLSKPKKAETIKGRIASILNIDDDVKEELEAMTGLEYNIPDPQYLKALTAKAKVKKAVVVANKETPKRTLLMKTATKLVKAKAVSEKQPHKLVPKTEVPIANPIKITISSTTIEEIQNQVRQAGTTSEEKYKILDARDRLMRLKKQSKLKSLSTTKGTKGTCPDMCPEKERYLREYQRQLAFYEQLEGGEYRVNHRAAVKQYSRSSADQEEPMAHDLRPVKSLAMTMSYVLHEIADLCEGEDANLAEWYHYVWDRTRGVRKDITQQELCCPESVELVEQCARFHILSSERLCAEETAVFDPKINSENLTKCLQSLKYMYHDLREHGVTCPTEPEFRAYVILLNLNNGTFMSELATLPPQVQHSPEVKFALEVYSAIAMNNYSRFFKLVRKTTYLNACILMRYFNQVRVKALQVMVKAYCRTSSATEYPLYELIDILGFEDEEEAFEFCSRVGLKCDRDSLYMKLSRESFHVPDGNLEQNRAYSLVLSKRLSAGQSVGQCIAGGQLPEKTYEQHKPHCSFDAQGYLLPSSINAQDQNLGDPYEFVDDEPPPPPKPLVKPPNNLLDKKTLPSAVVKPLISDISVKPKQMPATPISPIFAPLPNKPAPLAASNDSAAIKAQELPKLFEPPASTANSNIFSKSMQPSVFSTPANAKPAALPPPNSPFNLAANKSIFSGVAGQTNLFKAPTPPVVTFKPELPAITSSSPNERPPKRRLEEPPNSTDEKKSLLEREEQARRHRELQDRLRREKEKLELMERARELAKREYDKLELEIVKETCAALCRAELDRLRRIEESGERLYEELLREICAAVLDEQLFIQDMLMEVERRLRDRLLGKYCRVWRQWAARRRAQRREALDNTPVWLQPESLEECARKLFHPEQRVAIKYAREKKRRSVEVVEKKPRHTPIEFIVSVGLKENAKSFEAEPSQHTFWKLVISWPILENKLALWRHKKAVNKYLSPEDFTQEPIFIEHRPSPQEQLDVCIRHFEGLICETCLTGTDALLFIAAPDEDARSVERRLTKSVLAREKLMPIPLCVLVFGDAAGAKDQRPAGLTATLESLLESGHVSEYTVLTEASSDELVALKLFQSAVLWLAINRSPAVPLVMDYLKRLFDDCITEELWLRIQGHLLPNPQLSKALLEPNFIIGLHNEAVNHIIDIVLDPESMSYTDFAPELKIYLDSQRKYPCNYEYFDSVWKHPEYRAELERVMSTFILPTWKFEWPIHDLMELHKAIVSYCRQTIPHADSLSVTNDIISDLFMVTSEDSCPNFADVVIHIVEKKINNIGGNTRVVFNKNHIKHFQTLPWWFKSSVVIDYVAKHPIVEEEEVDDGVEADSVITSQEIATSTAIEFDMDCNIDEMNETCQQHEEEQPLKELCDETRSHATEVRSVVEKLERQLEEQRLKSQSLEERLKEALQDDFLDVGS